MLGSLFNKAVAGLKVCRFFKNRFSIVYTSFHSFYFHVSRNSRPDVFCKKGVLRNFPKFTGKHPCKSLFFNKVADLRPETLLKKRLWDRCFPVNFAKFLRKSFLTEHLWWLLLCF